MPPSVDFAIVGQGLAGTALAWHLLRRGRRVLVLDRERGGSASRVAAGLITPVTGKRLAKSWRWDELFPAAATFYRSVEAETGARFFRQRSSLRIFASEAEREEFRRREGTILRGLVRPVPEVKAEWFAAPFGGFEMPGAARLDVPRFLDASRDFFRARGAYATAEVTAPESLGAETVVLCRGYAPEPEPRFGGIRFNAAKGEILTVRIPGLAEERVVHRGVWLVPAGGEVFHVGATHTWEPLDVTPTPEGRAEIESKLRAFLKLPYEVIGHRAAVRPVIDAGYPVLGRHPGNPRLAYFNGLGAKGSLLAPFFADQLAAHLCGEGEIDPAVNVARFLVHPRPGFG
jgi:glycine/D-amino acid oxidase-like deaminating enzyme